MLRLPAWFHVFGVKGYDAAEQHGGTYAAGACCTDITVCTAGMGC